MQARLKHLYARDIYKFFHNGEVTALDGAAIRLQQGEVHGLLGENGSGKTTLIRCLAGRLQPDRGEINDSSRIAIVPQQPELIPSLSLNDYLRLAAPKRSTETAARAQEFFCEIGVNIPLHTAAHKLPANQVTLGVLLGALLQNPDFLILDEPTTSFTPSETDNLFRYLKKLATAGLGIVLVSHKIPEIYSRADRLTVLRKGRVVRECTPEETDLEELSRLIMGDRGSTENRKVENTVNYGPVCLTFRGAGTTTRGTSLSDISFELRSGEILAVTGIRENGLDQLEQVLTLETALNNGAILLDNRRPYPASPENLRDSGVVIIPSDRQRSGAALTLSIADNAAAGARKTLGSMGRLSGRERKEYAAGLLSSYGIQASVEASAATLSGGMLQRLILARDLESPGEVLILCEPGWGLDVRSRSEIYGHIRELSRRGKGILLLASDIDEVLDIADRLLVLYNGRIGASFLQGEFDHQVIGDAILGMKGNKK